MKKYYQKLMIISVIFLAVSFTACNRGNSNVENSNEGDSPFAGSASEEYYMVTFQSGIDYWQKVYAGFEYGGELFGIKTVYTGSVENDINQARTVLEQVIAKKPAGIAVSVPDAEAYIDPINSAIAQGIPVVTFDSDSPKSDRYSYISTGNYNAGSLAARAMARAIGESGKVGIVSTIGPPNIEQRMAGFKETIEKEFPNVSVVQTLNGGTDQIVSAEAAGGLLKSQPDIKGIFCTWSAMSIGSVTAIKEAGLQGSVKVVTFDTDAVTLDGIKAGEIEASIAQGTWNQGYWSMVYLYNVAHKLVKPVKDWEKNQVNPLPPSVEAGATIITVSNVDAFVE